MMTPPTLPRLPKEKAIELGKDKWMQVCPEIVMPEVWMLGVRAYRKSTMGNPKRNDVGIFDDMLGLVSPGVWRPENANTDPSRLGWNPGVGKPYGMLEPGVWWFYPGPHKGRSPAFRQSDDADVARKLGIPHDGKFLVKRMWGWDDPRNYLEWGHQQVNIHPAAMSSTSSWLCMTLPYDRAHNWLQTGWDELKKYKQKKIPLVLIDGPVI